MVESAFKRPRLIQSYYDSDTYFEKALKGASENETDELMAEMELHVQNELASEEYKRATNRTLGRIGVALLYSLKVFQEKINIMGREARDAGEPIDRLLILKQRTLTLQAIINENFFYPEEEDDE